jgi:hypothetical protein
MTRAGDLSGWRPDREEAVRILCLTGSLRRGSHNRRLLEEP